MKTREEILEYVMGNLTGGWNNGTALDAYNRLVEHAKKNGDDECFYWNDLDICDYAPYTDYAIGAFIELIDNHVDSLDNFLNDK